MTFTPTLPATAHDALVEAASYADGKITTGTADPTGTPVDGDTYYQKDIAGQVVAVWLGSGGAWGKALGPGPYVSLTQMVGQSIPYNVDTAMSWDQVREDTDGMYNAANPTRLTVTRAGVYYFEGRYRFGATATTGTRHWWIQKNGTDYLQFIILNGTDVASTSPFAQTVIATDRCAVGDYIEFGFFQNIASPNAVSVDKRDQMSPEARAVYLRP